MPEKRRKKWLANLRLRSGVIESKMPVCAVITSSRYKEREKEDSEHDGEDIGVREGEQEPVHPEGGSGHWPTERALRSHGCREQAPEKPLPAESDVVYSSVRPGAGQSAGPRKSGASR
ncbi:hypothetical protein UPYG_G00243400 [Umbra pygmaea]|uniref:Uncharacterized protein n=1 Tax=Umbra pygmaea TaxID=75934 RepID=A0ABD0WFT7_UMBPY